MPAGIPILSWAPTQPRFKGSSLYGQELGSHCRLNDEELFDNCGDVDALGE